MEPATFPAMPKFDEDVARCWADVLRFVAEGLGAPSFAAGLARYGYTNASWMSKRWLDGGFEPQDFATYLQGWGSV